MRLTPPVAASLFLALALGPTGCGGCVTPPATDGGDGDDAGNTGGDDGGEIVGALPAVTIEAPADGAYLAVGEATTFTGTATDAEDGALTGESVAWASDRDGVLGTGTSVTATLTTVGDHVITLAAEDSDGQVSSTSVTVHVVDNLPPEVTIVAPTDGASFSLGESITFTCAATDAEDGAIPNVDIAWASDVQGALGIGATVVNALAVVGDHTITCAATDSGGAVGTASITVTVVDNFAPEVSILTPDDGAYFLTGTSVAFTGVATDAEDGALSGLSLRWFAGVTQIGSGASIQTTLPDGTHVVRLEATDAQGAVGFAEITIHFVDNLPPVCVISAPADGATIPAGNSVQLTASCTDPDGTGAIPNVDVSWSSDLDGVLGTGASVQNALVTPGTHTLTVCAKDTEDATLLGCETVVVTVFVNEPPLVGITAPTAGTTAAACTSIALSCAASDPEGQGITYQWSSSAEGDIGGGAERTWLPDVSGAHVVTCTATDALGATSSASVTVTVASPSVSITAPLDGAAVGLGEPVQLSADACDTEDGPLQGGAVVWTATPGGALGTGRNVTVNGLTAGAHVITVDVADADGHVAQDTITITVNERPVVTITAPVDGAVFPLASTTEIALTATAVDAEDGALTPTWTIDPTGIALVGLSTTLTTLVPGFHDVVARATDSVGLVGTDQIRISLVGDDPLVETLLGAGVISGASAGNGVVYVASSQGVIVLDATTLAVDATLTQGNSDLPRTNTLSVAALGGGALVGQQQGLAVCDADLQNCDPRFSDGDTLNLDNFSVRAVAVLPDGRVLVGTEQCMLLASADFDTRRRFCQGDGGGDGLAGERVNDFAVDPATGAVWIATDDGASLMIPAPPNQTQNEDATTFTDFDEGDGLADKDVRGIAIAPSGDVWFATASGVTRRAGPTDVVSWTAADGLGDDATHDVAIDVVTIATVAREIAWIATDGGLSRIDETAPSVLNISTAEGLVSNQCRSVTVLAGHEKLVGTTSGMSVYRGY